MLDRDGRRDEAAVSLAEGAGLLAGGLIMIWFQEALPTTWKDWLWLGFSGLVTVSGAVVTVGSWRRLWVTRRRR